MLKSAVHVLAALQVCCPLAVASVHIEKEHKSPSVINGRVCAAGKHNSRVCAAIFVLADPPPAPTPTPTPTPCRLSVT